MVLIVFIIVIYMIFFHVGETDIVVTVNGEGITAEELKQHMSQNKAYAISYFKEAYDAKVDHDFWNRQYEDTTPNEYLREYTLKQLVRYKVEQQLAVSYGLLEQEETTYQSFLQQLEKENDSRSSKANSDEIVYGVTKYTESTYFSYLYSNMQLRLQDKLAEEGEPLYVSDEELKKWYSDVKEERFVGTDTIVLQSYSITLEDTDSIHSETAAYLEELQKDLKAGKSAEELQGKYEKAEYQELTMDDDSASGMQKNSQTFYEAAQNLEKGEVSEVLCDRNTYMVLKCISREKGEAKDFEEYKSGIRKEYTSDRYTEYIDGLVEKAVTVINRKYEKVGI